MTIQTVGAAASEEVAPSLQTPVTTTPDFLELAKKYWYLLAIGAYFLFIKK